MLLHSQFSAFASITQWFHGSVLRLSEDDRKGFVLQPSLHSRSALLSIPPSSPSGVRVANNSLTVVTLGLSVANNSLTVVTLGLDPRAHAVILLHSQFSAFASITQWFHGSALRLSEDDKGGFCTPAVITLEVSAAINPTVVTLRGQRRKQFSLLRHPQARPEGPCRDVASFTVPSVCLDHGMVPRIGAGACPRMTRRVLYSPLSLSGSTLQTFLSIVTLGGQRDNQSHRRHPPGSTRGPMP